MYSGFVIAKVAQLLLQQLFLEETEMSYTRISNEESWKTYSLPIMPGGVSLEDESVVKESWRPFVMGVAIGIKVVLSIDLIAAVYAKLQMMVYSCWHMRESMLFWVTTVVWLPLIAIGKGSDCLDRVA